MIYYFQGNAHFHHKNFYKIDHLTTRHAGRSVVHQIEVGKQTVRSQVNQQCALRLDAADMVGKDTVHLAAMTFDLPAGNHLLVQKSE